METTEVILTVLWGMGISSLIFLVVEFYRMCK